MAERYKQLIKTDKQYQIDCPVMLAASALLLDTQTQHVFAQLKLQSLVSKPISAVYVTLECFDPAGSTVLCHENFWFRDFTIHFAEQFGQKTAIPISNDAVRKFTVHIETIVFADGQTWSGAEPWRMMQNLTEREPLSLLFEAELAERFTAECKKLSRRNTAVALKKQDNINLCACGAIYDSSEEKCPSCGIAFEAYELLSEKSNLEANLIEYREIQRIKAEKAAAEQVLAVERNIADKKRKMKRRSIFLPLIAAVTILLILLVTVIAPNMLYEEAKDYFDTEDYAQAIASFQKVGAYKDARNQIERCISKLGVAIYAGDSYTVVRKANGTWASNQTDSESIATYTDWQDIIAFSEGGYGNNYLYLKADGSVVATGSDYGGEFDVSSWQDIVAVSAGNFHSVGLKSDGRVVATGNNSDGQCNVSNWQNIVAISVGIHHTVGLTSNGTVVAVGRNSSDQCNVGGWEDIVAISAGGYFTVGLKADGTVVAVGSNNAGECNVSGWRNIVEISTGEQHTVGLKANGLVVTTGLNNLDQCSVSNWHNIVAISAGPYHTVGLKSDGSIVAIGRNYKHQCDIAGLKLW